MSAGAGADYSGDCGRDQLSSHRRHSPCGMGGCGRGDVEDTAVRRRPRAGFLFCDPSTTRSLAWDAHHRRRRVDGCRRWSLAPVAGAPGSFPSEREPNRIFRF